ncbi:MAG: hypothetical protein C4536_00595 [Actinobacteria bacterium]|jgi:hypothetical protein|nr:MAG: hypothetical protein C4536_00595 [Actinomycetota bacterium]
MGRISYWYSGLSRGAKTAITVCGIAVAVIVAAVILYMVLTPEKVEVRYGTIVRDPIDGYVWENNTQTIWVNPSEAGNYRIEYIDKLSPEHEEQLKQEQEKIASEQQQLEESTGLEAMETAFPTDTLAQLNTLQQNIETMGQDIISGMEMANEIYEAQVTLMEYRNQVATMQLPPEFEGLRQQALQIFDMYIKACDLYLEAIASGDLTLVDQANALIQEASGMIQSLIPSY